ncbi:hypothetical protein JHK85_018257 [Glycine max]|nr:hypothetical protein JHK85_018257 [Glycine max]KAG5037022.1 hypothetical protein JHK86_017862 [Glycine max]
MSGGNNRSELPPSDQGKKTLTRRGRWSQEHIQPPESAVPWNSLFSPSAHQSAESGCFFKSCNSRVTWNASLYVPDHIKIRLFLSQLILQCNGYMEFTVQSQTTSITRIRFLFQILQCNSYMEFILESLTTPTKNIRFHVVA